MPRLITDVEALDVLVAEYNQRKAWQTGGLQLAWIEKAVHDVPDAFVYGFRVEDVCKIALLLLKAGLTPEEVRELAGNIDAVFDIICGLLSKETQEVVNQALSHWPFSED